MNPHPTPAVLVKFDKWSWYLFVAWFVVALMLQMFAMSTAVLVAYWGIVLVLINNLFRLLLVAEQFREPDRPRYRLMTYLLLVVLLVSVGVQFLIR